MMERSLSQWDCRELADQIIAAKITSSISASSIWHRKRLKISDFADKNALSERLQAFISEWNTKAHPFGWNQKSTLKIIAKCQIPDDNFTSQIDLAIAA